MSYDLERYSDLVGALHEGVSDHQALPAALRDLANLAGVEKASVIHSFADGSRRLSAAVGLEARSISDYNRHFHRLDRLLPNFGAPSIAFTRATENAYWPEFARTEFYNDWARPYDNNQVVVVTVPSSDGVQSSLLLVASARDGQFGSAGQVMLLQLLAPHFRRALAMSANLTASERRSGPLLAALERAPYGVVILDRRARLLHATGTAVEIMTAGDGLRLTARGIRALDPQADRTLGALIARALASEASGSLCPPQVVVVPRPSTPHPFLIQVCPVSVLSQGADRDPIRTRRAQGAAIVTIVDSSRTRRPSPDLLRMAFGLTRSEAAIALSLLDGQELKTVAAERGVSLSTVRTQLLHVFDKTQTHRQADLIRLLANLLLPD